MYFAGFVARFFPWAFIHAAAVPIAVRQIWRTRSHATSARTALLAGFYLAWLFQAVVLQHLFDYIHAPAILLGLAVVMGECLGEERLFARMCFAAFVLIGFCVVGLKMSAKDFWAFDASAFNELGSLVRSLIKRMFQG